MGINIFNLNLKGGINKSVHISLLTGRCEENVTVPAEINHIQAEIKIIYSICSKLNLLP
jgi:hypothetical protein